MPTLWPRCERTSSNPERTSSVEVDLHHLEVRLGDGAEAGRLLLEHLEDGGALVLHVGVGVLAVDVEDDLADRVLGHPVLGEGLQGLVRRCSSTGWSSSYGAFSLMPTVAWMIFLTVLDLPVLVIPKRAVRLPRKSCGLTYTGTSFSCAWNRRLEL